MENLKQYPSSHKPFYTQEKPRAKRSIEPQKESPWRQIFIFLLAIIPAILLGFLLIYLANKATQEYKEEYDPDDYYYYFYHQGKPAQSGYWHYLQQLEQIKKQEESKREGEKGAIEKIGQQWEDQKDQLRFQQEQQKLEQQRIKMLLQQMKNR